MKRLIGLSFVIYHLSFSPAGAQEWTVRQCMQYAVAHNHEVKRAELELDSYRAARTGAMGRFLPAVDAGIGAQYNFGRAIDPETNGYTDVSTFYNGYSLSASFPLFDGFSRLHALRAAKAGVLMGLSALRQQQNLTALQVLQACTDVLYYEGTVSMARERQQEADLLERQTQVMLEVGRKSHADLAQVQAQQAEAAYELTRQQNLLASALLALKQLMGLPLTDSLRIAGSDLAQAQEPTVPNRHLGPGSTEVVMEQNPALLQAYHNMQISRHEWCQARAALCPSLSLSAGLNTTYYHTLHTDAGQPFHTQFKNNMGEYVGVTLSIPLFNRLQTVTSIRRAKNNYRIAREAYEQKQTELEKLSREAWQDRQSYQKQAEQMGRKVEADSMACLLTRRQFEEGLSTAIDLRTTSAQLLNSKATLLQCRLMTIVKEHLIRYYRGESIWE